MICLSLDNLDQQHRRLGRSNVGRGRVWFGREGFDGNSDLNNLETGPEITKILSEEDVHLLTVMRHAWRTRDVCCSWPIPT